MAIHFCKRTYLSLTGFVLGAFLVVHLAMNLLGLWPDRLQAAVDALHSLGWKLTAIEIVVVFVPLAIHIVYGLRVLWHDKLKYNPDKERGSPLGQCLQQASALGLLVFLALHLPTLHRWFGGRFDPAHAALSISDALWRPFGASPSAAPLDSLVAWFYPAGLLAALFHAANGLYTGADILRLTPTHRRQIRLWRASLAGMAILLLAALSTWYAAAP